MRHSFKYLFLCGLIFSGMYLSAQFTEKRGKRGPSMSSLKETCCTLYGDVLQSSADLLCSLGAVQKKALQAIEGYVNGDKQSWTETASRQKLTTAKDKLARLQKKIERLTELCLETVSAIDVS